MEKSAENLKVGPFPEAAENKKTDESLKLNSQSSERKSEVRKGRVWKKSGTKLIYVVLEKSFCLFMFWKNSRTRLTYVALGRLRIFNFQKHYDVTSYLCLFIQIYTKYLFLGTSSQKIRFFHTFTISILMRYTYTTLHLIFAIILRSLFFRWSTLNFYFK